MRHSFSIFCSRSAFRLALTGLAASALAGCANSDRLSDPFKNPFQTSSNDLPTSSIDPSAAGAPATSSAAPVSPVQSRPLSAPVQSHATPPAPGPRVASGPARPSQGVAGWSAQGGTPVSVAAGENAEILSRRYGVPADAIVRANGLTSASQVQPGSRVVIPVYNAALAASSGAAVAEAVAKPVPPAHTAAGQVKLLKGAPPASQLAATSPKPVKQTAEAKPAPEAKPASRTIADASATQKEAAKKVAPPKDQFPAQGKITPGLVKTETASIESKPSAPEPAASASAESKAGGASDAANPEFRWPARGRIIQAFKPGGNDGINIAVPEGTSVKAAESGVVAYAGSELKGYGNLVLIRHPNGFVSAYANNGDIEVKRGETVKRGQTIAKSGQSGNVASPQLHFELRKGSTPVDPTQYLAGL